MRSSNKDFPKPSLHVPWSARGKDGEKVSHNPTLQKTCSDRILCVRSLDAQGRVTLRELEISLSIINYSQILDS